MPEQTPKAEPVADGRRLSVLVKHPASGWLVIAALILVQWGLFRQYALREVVWSYPFCWDQTTDLLRSYTTYEQILTTGLIPGLKSHLLALTGRGFMMTLQASILFLLLGASRLTALTQNFAYFAFFQCALAGTLRWLTGLWSAAFLGVGLLLTAATPFFCCGGVMDFRIDFSAFCLYGVLICAVIRSRTFASWRWSIVTGALATLLVLFRFFTIVYVAGIFIALLICFGVRAVAHRRDLKGRAAVLRQIYGLVIAGIIVVAVTTPALWHNRTAIWSYYVVVHVTSDDKLIWAHVAGVYTTLDSLLFYARSLLHNHVGRLLLSASMGTLLVATGTFVLQRVLGGRRMQIPRDARWMYVFLVLSFLVPYAALTADVAKSNVVGSILVPPLLWLVLLTAVLLFGAVRGRPPHWSTHYGLGALAFLALAAGISYQFDRLGRRTETSRHRAEIEQVLALHDLVFEYGRDMGWKDPGIAVDRIVDYFNAPTYRPLIYERHGVLVGAHSSLNGVESIGEAEAIEALRASDFAMLCVPAPEDPIIYPFEKAMQAIDPQLLDFCDHNMILLRHVHAFNRDLRLYVRPALRLTGDVDGWITSDGIVLSGVSDALAQRPRIELRGKSDFRALARLPDVKAELSIPDHPPERAPATLVTEGDRYRIVMRVQGNHLPVTVPVQIRLSFDAYFIPKDRGLETDARKLVMRAPETIELLAAQPSPGPAHPADSEN